MRLLVIGGNAAGMSAASRVKRRSPETEVIVLEKSNQVSFGACGLPYYISGENDNIELIKIRPVEKFRESGIDVRLSCEVMGVDFNSKQVSYKENGENKTLTYDKLVISSGSSAKVPPIKGIEQDNIFSLKTIENAISIKNAITKDKVNVVIIGGGYIGIEIAEACLNQKVASIRIIEATVFDKEFSEACKAELESQGVNIHLGEKVTSFEGVSGKVSAVVTDKGRYEADVVILSIGVMPNTGFAKDIDKLGNGAIITNERMETSQKDVYSAGDCASVIHRITGKNCYFALGTNANKQGRLVGDSCLGKDVCF